MCIQKYCCKTILLVNCCSFSSLIMQQNLPPCPVVTLQVAQEKQTVFGQELEVTVGYTSPQPQEDCVLAVTGLDAVRMAPTMLEQALRHYFKLPSNGGHDILSCGITDGTVYIDFPDTTSKLILQVHESI